MVFIGIIRGKKRVIFRVVLFFVGLLFRVFFWDNNKDVIFNNLVIFKFLLLELDGKGLFFLSLEG